MKTLHKYTLAFFVGIVLLLSPAAFAADDLATICAQDTNKNSSLCNGYEQGVDDNAKNPILTLLQRIINILSFFVGVLAVFFVMFGGFKYITSAGDAGKVTSAKNTILYALIGLVVVVISRQLILFVLSKVL